MSAAQHTGRGGAGKVRGVEAAATAVRPGRSAGMRRRDLYGIAAVLASLLLVLTYRQSFVEPREWVALCAQSTPPIACAPRAALGWLQHWQLWGVGALLLGGWAFLLRAPFAARVAAVALGAVAAVNYNATWGLLGAALGAWAWIRPEPGRRDEAPTRVLRGPGPVTPVRPLHGPQAAEGRAPASALRGRAPPSSR